MKSLIADMIKKKNLKIKAKAQESKKLRAKNAVAIKNQEQKAVVVETKTVMKESKTLMLD